ncbi:MAG: hypothetical protein IJF95_01855 [Erysipelotrichaceae bacterium]|nr:hypothetical protein [Erysipelotrichaceae bacterium]
MQLKLYKRSTFLLSLIVLIEVGSIVYMLTHPEIFKGRVLAIIFGFVALMFVLTAVYTAIDLNMDKNLIRKRVSNGDVAWPKSRTAPLSALPEMPASRTTSSGSSMSMSTTMI